MKIAQCILAETGDYTQSLTVNSVDALPSHVELSLSSVLRTAKDPEAEQIIHRVLVDKALLPDVIAALSKAAEAA